MMVLFLFKRQQQQKLLNNNVNILRLVVQTKAMVCATILFSRSEEKSTSLWDHIESVS